MTAAEEVGGGAGDPDGRAGRMEAVRSSNRLVAYDSGSFDDSATNTVEWMVTGADTEFSHSVAADPSGNALGPFAAGSTVKLRTRVTNGNGTTTGSVRTLVITAP